MYKNKKIGVVVPAYNEEMFIEKVINGIPEFVDCIFVVDDASTDSTAEVASKMLLHRRERLKVIKHKNNFGVGKAITTGYTQCLIHNIDIAVVMAGDNQMDPVQLPRLLDPIFRGIADYVIGDRISNLRHMKGMSNWRRVGNGILRWITRISAWNFSICDPQNGYTAITRKALLQLDLHSVYHRYGYCNDIIVKLSANKVRINQVAMPAVYGSEKSKIRYWQYIPTVSWLLLKDFIWRIKMQLFNHHSTNTLIK